MIWVGRFGPMRCKMKSLFCRCGYCRMQNRRVWSGIVSLIGAIVWLISPTPSMKAIRVPVDDEQH